MRGGRIGIDLVPFGRVRALLGSEAGLTRLLSPAELRLSCPPAGPDVPGIAGRLAAKEAVFKLFQVKGQTLPWLGIEILKADTGHPVVHLRGRAAQLAQEAQVGRIEVSIAHDEPCAIAVAFAPASDN